MFITSITNALRFLCRRVPRNMLFLGNLLDLPTSHEWLKYAEWTKEFSMFPVAFHLSDMLIELTVIDSNFLSFQEHRHVGCSTS